MFRTAFGSEREEGVGIGFGAFTEDCKRAVSLIGDHSDEIIVKLWEGLDSRYRFENTDVNIDGSAVVANGPEAVYEDHRKEQAQTGDLQQLESDLEGGLREHRVRFRQKQCDSGLIWPRESQGSDVGIWREPCLRASGEWHRLRSRWRGRAIRPRTRTYGARPAWMGEGIFRIHYLFIIHFIIYTDTSAYTIHRIRQKSPCTIHTPSRYDPFLSTYPALRRAGTIFPTVERPRPIIAEI